jgi:hypothetical protein
MVKSFFLFVFFLSIAVIGNAQTTQTQESWWDYLNQDRFSEHWGTWIDVQAKLKDSYVHQQNFNEFTLGASYFKNQNFKYVGSITYVDQFPATGRNYHLAEYRPWQMLQYISKTKSTRFIQWLRLEERFKQMSVNSKPADKYDFTYRFRYYILAQIPMSKHKYEKGSLSFVSSDEVFFNFGNSIVYNTFDQNRLFLGFYYYMTKANIFQLGYTNVFQKNNAPNKYLKSDVLRVSVFNTIDFRKKVKTKEAAQ